MLLLNNLRIGILGGSFDPAHFGHVHISKIARQKLGLDLIIWLVARHNPFKPGQSSFEQRFKTAQQQAHAPWIHVSDLEDRLNLTSSFDALSFFCRPGRNARSVFLMGSDVFCQLPLWHRAHEIPSLMPLAILPRSGHQRRARHSPLAARLAAHILPESQARALVHADPPAIIFLTAPMCDISSSAWR